MPRPEYFCSFVQQARSIHYTFSIGSLPTFATKVVLSHVFMLTKMMLCLDPWRSVSTFEMRKLLTSRQHVVTHFTLMARLNAHTTPLLILYSACTTKDWSYAAEHSADLYRVTLHSAIDISPHEAWYGERDLAADMHIWGCHVSRSKTSLTLSNCARL
jgi:hypothetical protein